MPEGGIIKVQAENVDLKTALGIDSRVRISVQDKGCGIPDDDLPRYSDYFTTKPGGSGLGLATAYAIIVKHGGNLSVETKSGTERSSSLIYPPPKRAPRRRVPLLPRYRRGRNAY